VDAATKRRLQQGAPGLSGAQIDRLARYFDLLLQWNRKINLTAITDPPQVVDRHFLDSLAVLPLVANAGTLVDIGSGGGFPGAVLATVRPELAVTAVDSIRKKVAFLETLRIELARNLEPVTARHDELVRNGRTFDVAISRATWDPSEWVTQGAPLVRPGGLLIAMQTGEQATPVAPPGFVAEPVATYSIEGVERYLRPFRRA
jgi:16S rRNA (guanine527-N7)-methyltransferase